MKSFEYVTDPYISNCLIEMIKAKIKNFKNTKVYYCKPRFSDGRFQFLHFMWSNDEGDFDFSDEEENHMPWYRSFLFRGRIRKFRKGFAKRYSDFRNKSR